MSTRGIIARATGGEGEFCGAYNHSDSYPTWMGKHLWQKYHEEYRGNLKRMLRDLIDKQPKDNKDITHKELGQWIGIEWLWVFDEKQHRLFVRDHRNDADVAIVDLRGLEPDWLLMQCGEDLERCSHYAWVHFPEMKHSRLGTHTYLGRQAFDFHDITAVIVNGKRYTATGSGSRRDGRWISCVKARNGRRLDLPTAFADGNEYRPFTGVTWVFPPTRDNPNETYRTDGNEEKQ